MISFSEMYSVFESPFPTLLTHTDNGLGIFVAHPKIDIAIKNIGPDNDMFRVIAGDLNFFFPLKEHARVLLSSRGGLIAFTDEVGMPWYTLEMLPQGTSPSAEHDSTLLKIPAKVIPVRGTFGRSTIRTGPAPPERRHQNDEGEFSL